MTPDVGVPAPGAAPLQEGRARVLRRDGPRLWLRAEAPAACGGCATRGLCGGASAAPREWPVAASVVADAQPGDLLQVGVDRAALARASLLAYGGPLLATLAGAIGATAAGAGDAAAAGAAGVGLLAGAGVARTVARRYAARLVPVVIGRADGSPAGCGGPR